MIYNYAEHANEIGDWCPWSGRSVDVSEDEADDDYPCPAMCPDSDIERD